jgi:fatty acid desaturase
MMNTSLCKYRHIFGVEGKGIHSVRLFNIAVIDVAGTILGAFLLSYFTGWNFVACCIVFFALGIIVHRIFCVNTTVNKAIFGIV